MPVARVGKRCNFDGNTEVTCVLQEANRNGVQIVAEGFNIEDATITMVSAMDVESVVPPPDGETGIKHAIVGRVGFAFKGIKIDGLDPGDYALTIIQ